MTDARPHIVGVVGNDIVFDTRIRKVAAAAVAAGFRATILCYTASGPQRTTDMAGVDVIRVPIEFRAHVKNGRVPAPLRPFAGNELVARHLGPRIHEQARRQRLEAEARTTPSLVVSLRLFMVRLAMRIRHDIFRVRRKAHVTWDRIVRRFNLTRVRTTLRLFPSFRDGVPNIADYEVAFTPILEELKPDLIHAHDYHMIGLAVTAARNLRASGHATKVLYDAHELVEGLSYPNPTIKGWLKLEKDFIHDVDAVTGVSPEQLGRIRERYHLSDKPTLVMNAPVVRGRHTAETDVRDDIGVSGPILVYHGNVFEERGLDTLIEALVFLDEGVNVAVLAPEDHPLVEAAQELSESLGVESRLHILGYVPGEQLPEYLSTADMEVIPYLPTGNNEIALPNKLFEGIQAGLPILTSNMKSMGRYVSERGIGEVFEAGSAADLAQKAQTILDDAGTYRSRLTPEVRHEASWDTQAGRLVTVYNTLLDTNAPTDLEIAIASISESADLEARDGKRITKLGIGPRNMAGQAFMIAAAVQTHFGIPAVSFSMEEAGFGFPIHQQITGEEWRDPAWQLGQRRALADNFTHVIAESGTGMLGTLYGGFIDEQLPELRENGLEVAVLLHGSEIRDPRRHRQLPFSPYAVDNDLTRALEKATARLRRHLDGLDIPIFATTPDVLEDIDATWLPVVVDVRSWANLKPAFISEVPTVLHLPSSSHLKGSEFVDTVMFELEEAGRIRYLRPDNPVPTADVMTLVEQADIVVDQLVIGAYGVMSCQAMAAGRLTVANTRDIGSLRDDCPIISADPGTLREVVDDVLNNSARWQDRADAGHRFVETYHNGAYTAETLGAFLNLK